MTTKLLLSPQLLKLLNIRKIQVFLLKEELEAHKKQKNFFPKNGCIRWSCPSELSMLLNNATFLNENFYKRFCEIVKKQQLVFLDIWLSPIKYATRINQAKLSKFGGRSEIFELKKIKPNHDIKLNHLTQPN